MKTKEQPEDYSESDYRRRIVNELSYLELRDRLCETKTELENIRAEWFKLKLNNIGKKEYPEITVEEIRVRANKYINGNTQLDNSIWMSFIEGAKWMRDKIKEL